jgi:hypothetical protein
VNAALIHATGIDGDQIFTKALKLLLHLSRCAFANRNRADHRADADDDAQHRKQRAHFVAR